MTTATRHTRAQPGKHRTRHRARRQAARGPSASARNCPWPPRPSARPSRSRPPVARTGSCSPVRSVPPRMVASGQMTRWPSSGSPHSARPQQLRRSRPRSTTWQRAAPGWTGSACWPRPTRTRTAPGPPRMWPQCSRRPARARRGRSWATNGLAGSAVEPARAIIWQLSPAGWLKTGKKPRSLRPGPKAGGPA